MPGGFLLTDDAATAAQTSFDNWVKEQQDKAAQAAQAATQKIQTAVAPVQAAVAPVTQAIDEGAQNLQQGAQDAQQRFDQWAQQQLAAQPPPAPTPPVVPPVATPSLTPPAPGAVGQGDTPQDRFDSWVQQQHDALAKAAAPVQAAVTDAVSAGAQRVDAAVQGVQGTANNISQFNDPQLTADEAYSACGPAAAVRFAQMYGRNPTLREATDLAAQVGWTSQNGMAGIQSEKALMDKLGVQTHIVGADWNAIAKEAQTGNPVTISTPGHYFMADGYDAGSGAFHVGRSGLDLKGGSEWMTPNQMEGRMGALQGALFADNPTIPGRGASQGAPGAQAAPATGASDQPPNVRLDPTSTDSFYNSLAPAAQWIQQKTGINATAMLAIVANETGYGRSDNARDKNNLFSIQGDGSNGSRWASYSSPLDSFQAFADLIQKAPRYAQAWADRDDPNKFIDDLRNAGYVADEPGFPAQGWVDQVKGIIGRVPQTIQQAADSAVQAVDTTRQNVQDAFNQTVSSSGQVAQNAQNVMQQGQTQLDQLRAQMDKATADFKAAQDALDAQHKQFQDNLNQQISKTQADIQAPRDFGAPLRAAQDNAGQFFNDLGTGVSGRLGEVIPKTYEDFTKQIQSPTPQPSNIPGTEALSTGLSALGTGSKLVQDVANEVSPLTAAGRIHAGEEQLLWQDPQYRDLMQQAGITQDMSGGEQANRFLSLPPELKQQIQASVLGVRSQGLAAESQAAWQPGAAREQREMEYNLIGAVPATALMPGGLVKTVPGIARAVASMALQPGNLPFVALFEGIGPAARGGMLAARWAASSVEDIARDLMKTPIGSFVRDEAGHLDLDKLTQVAQQVKEQVTRVYSGTVGDYPRADLTRANPESLYGPGYYTTEDARIAGGRVTEPESGWAAQYGNAERGIDYGRIFPTQAAARADAAQQRADMLAQYSGLKPADVPMPIIVQRSKAGGVVEAEGYAQAAGERAGLPGTGTFESYDRNIAQSQKRIDETQRAIEVEPYAKEKERLQNELTRHQDDLEYMQQRREQALNQPAGIAVRPLDVPKSLNLFDIDAQYGGHELGQLAEEAASQGLGQTERTLLGLSQDAFSRVQPTGQDVYDALQRDAGLSKTQVNDFLEKAGYDGITHEGGQVRPMADEVGNPIQHQVRVLFQSGLDKSRTLAGTQAGVIPNAAAGGAAGAGAGDDQTTPQERLYRGLGGAFVAGALRNKNPAVAAFETNALRKGATAMDIANAVQTARKTAGKAYKFSGPIADAANAALKAAPSKEQILAARQMLRDFGGNLQQAASPNFQTDSGAARMHNFLLELAHQGESQRFWYTNASDAIKEATGNDPVKGEKLAQLFAIYSPGNTVTANTQMALAAWHQFLEGQPIKVGKGQLDEKASRLLYDNIPWEGRKTNNFYSNLMKTIDPSVFQKLGRETGQTGTTVDIWMMRALKYLQDAPSTKGDNNQYEFAQRAIERVAKELGWQPDEAQAAIWSAVKAADEGTPLQEAGFHYGTGLAQRAGRVGELAPTTGDDGALQRVFGLFGKEGAPALPSEKGSRTVTDAAGNVVRGPDNKPLTENIPENKGMISAAANQTVSAYAAARAWLQKLPEISWARVFPDKKPTLRDSNALVVDVGRPLDDTELAQLRAKLPDTVSVTQTDTGAWIINHDGSHVRTPNMPGADEQLAGQWIGSDNRAFHKSADAAVQSLDTVQDASTYPLRADSTTLKNDWSQAPNGEDYAHVINGSARAGAFWDVADPLAKRIADASGSTAEHTAAIPDLRAGARPSPELPGGVPSASDIGGAAGGAASDVGRAPDLGGAATAAGATNGAPGAAAGSGGGFAGTVKDFLTGEGSEAGSAPVGAMLRAGQFAGGVAASEATQSDQDKQDPFGRFSRDVGFGLAAAAAPRVASAIARGGGVDYQALKAARPAQQGSLLTAASRAQTPAEMISAYTKQNLLSGAKTNVTNVISQLVEIAHQPLANLAAGHEEDAVAGIKAAGQSVPDALKNFANTMRTGQTQFSPNTTGTATSKFLPFFRLLSATDDFFRTIGWSMGAGMEGQRILREAGTGAGGASSVLGANANRINQAGEKAGKMSVFGEGGALGGDKISQIKQRLMASSSYKDQALGLLLDQGVPFSSVPGRIWNTGLARLPVVGETRGAVNLVKALRSGDQYAAQKAMGDMAISSVISTSIVSNIVNGNIRGPEDKEHPSGIKLNGQWYDYSSWGAWALPIALPAAWYEGIRNEGNKPNADIPKAIFNSTSKAFESQFYAADIIKTLNQIGTGNASGVLGQQASAIADRALPLSGALNNATALWDPIMRDPSNKGLAQIWEHEQQKIPGLEALLPAKPEMTSGQPQERLSSGPGQLIGMQTRSVSPLDATIADLERKGYKIPDPTQVPTEVSLRGSTIPLTEDEGRKLAVKRGQLINDALGQMAASPGWNKMSDNDKALTLSRVMARIDSRNAALWADMTPSADIDRRMAAGHTVVGRLQPTPTPALAGRR